MHGALLSRARLSAPALSWLLALLVLLVLLAALSPLAVPAPALAQDSSGGATGAPGVQADSTAQVDFGSRIRFELRASSDQPIASVLFWYEVDESAVQNTGVPTFEPGTSVVATYNWRVASVLVPGTEIRYQWELTTADGRRTTTKAQSVVYNDTRFAWREARDDQVTVYYPGAEAAAAQALLDEARKMQARVTRDYGLTLDKPLRIYAYVRAEDYTSALYTGQPLEASMTVGTDRIFVLTRDGISAMAPTLQGLRREMATALFLQKTSNPYAEPPRWLALGFGFVIGGEELPSETLRALGQVARANHLLPLRTLNGNFPNNGRDQNLAFVESAAVVQFIAATYGPEKLRALLAAFKEGNTVDDALKKGLGVSLDQFETRWKNALKSGAMTKPGFGQPRTQGPQGGEPSSDGSIPNRLLGPALRYWRGVFGPSTQVVLFGVAGVIGLGLVALIVGSSVAIWRRGRAEDD